MGNFNFSPTTGLLDTSSFPTNPGSEAAARQQFMTLFNQIKSYLNTFDANGIPANGGNSDTVDGKHANDFATSTHNHDSTYSNVSHGHAYYVDRNTPRFAWSGNCPVNTEVILTHNLNTFNLLVTFTTTVGNVNPTIEMIDANRIRIYNYGNTYYANNDFNYRVMIW